MNREPKVRVSNENFARAATFLLGGSAPSYAMPGPYSFFLAVPPTSGGDAVMLTFVAGERRR
eukprot:1477277-Rhodomonas_salina.1